MKSNCPVGFFNQFLARHNSVMHFFLDVVVSVAEVVMSEEHSDLFWATSSYAGRYKDDRSIMSIKCF